MAKRQFTATDTSLWIDRYGNGSSGAHTPSSGTDGQPNVDCIGTGATSAVTTGGVVGFANGDIVIIHQTKGTGAGNWELNKITSGAASTSWTMAYTLTNTYNAGAQAYKINQYSSVNIAGGVNIGGMAYNGSTGGIYAFICNGTATIAGSISEAGGGFKGGAGTWSNLGGNGTGATNGAGYTGDSITGVGNHVSDGTGGLRSPANSGGGMGGGVTNSGSEGGAGAGHGTAGTTTGGNSGGTTYDTANLVTASLGSGGGGGNDWEHVEIGGSGGYGGGFILIIAKTIVVSGQINNYGATGNARPGGNGYGGGGGSGGSVLLKGQIVTLGSNLVSAVGGVGLGVNPGGNGGVGRIHVDWGVSAPSGTTNPTADTSQDIVLNDIGNFFFSM